MSAVTKQWHKMTRAEWKAACKAAVEAGKREAQAPQKREVEDAGRV